MSNTQDEMIVADWPKFKKKAARLSRNPSCNYYFPTLKKVIGVLVVLVLLVLGVPGLVLVVLVLVLVHVICRQHVTRRRPHTRAVDRQHVNMFQKKKTVYLIPVLYDHVQ